MRQLSGRHAPVSITWSPVGFLAKALLVWCAPAAIVTYGHAATGAPVSLPGPDSVPTVNVGAHVAAPHVCRCGPRNLADQLAR